ncbi:MAG TPA: GNAT family N-acetyltransferase [Solirubrobacterales bacterium]|jgi:GNAT superfamily N-acetyltransferase|nr:GNAT family N-acetyltransferase [Solirubrobacterales bacterium]
MGQPIGEQELRRRALAGVRDEVEAFGSAAPDSQLLRRADLTASLVPASPQRSLFNSVYYDDPAVLAEEIDGLAELYDERGIRAWTVWVPDEDRQTAALLDARGHLLDAAPRAMAMKLAELGPMPPAPPGIEPRRADPATAAELNDRAYGYGEDGFRAGLAGETAIRWHGAYAGDVAVGCVGTIVVGDDDCCVTGVATPAEHRGRGIASWLMQRALAEARDEGLASASLQATKAGAPIYERLGFADHGFIEMWELRR